MSWNPARLRMLAAPLCGVASLSLYASTDYAPAIWHPICNSNWYNSGYGHKFHVVHDMEGYYASTIAWFDNCSMSSASIHYAVNGKQDATSDAQPGEITQLGVLESQYAWHAKCWNQHSTGTEHEGFASNPAWYTDAMYRASASCTAHIATKFGYAKDRNHVVGHNEKSSSAWVTYATANLGITATCNSHTDPGAYWDWSYYMSLVADTPAAPSGLTSNPLTSTQIKLAWTDNSTNETGFKIERSGTSTGTFTQIASVGANVTGYTNTGLTASTAYYYRVRAYNANGNSGYSNVRGATTGNSAPVLGAIGVKTVTEGSTLTFTATATDTSLGQSSSITDFESYASGTASVMFQKPGYSGSTSSLVDSAVTNYTSVTSTFPSGHAGTRVLRSTWAFNTGAANQWIRLTTISSVGYPNPVVDLRQIIKFDIYTDKPLKLGIGLRETTNATGTAIGSDGGTSGGIEWAGVTNVSGSAPVPTRSITTGTWQTVQFNLPFEPIRNFASGNGVLSTASGLGALEHLAFVAAGGTGTNNVYLDNFSVVYSNIFTFTLDAGAPAGASINPTNGVFTWTPTEAQGPGSYNITVRVTDRGSPALDDFETITVVVNETNNAAPVLNSIANSTILAGETLTFTNTATDGDLPTNLSYALNLNAAAGAGIDPDSGVFTWTPPLDAADSTNSFTVTVSDAGPPVLTDSKTFTVRVVSRTLSSTPVENGNISLNWSTLAGKKYRVQFKNSLSDLDWTDLSGDIVGDGATTTQSEAATAPERFYRIIEVP